MIFPMSPSSLPHHVAAHSRRAFLREACCGFGGLAFASLLEEQISRAAPANNPLAARAPHIPAKAKSVIFLFMSGGPSHLETFDPKPLLNELHGQRRWPEPPDMKRKFTDKESLL